MHVGARRTMHAEGSAGCEIVVHLMVRGRDEISLEGAFKNPFVPGRGERGQVGGFASAWREPNSDAGAKQDKSRRHEAGAQPRAPPANSIALDSAAKYAFPQVRRGLSRREALGQSLLEFQLLGEPGRAGRARGQMVLDTAVQ